MQGPSEHGGSKSQRQASPGSGGEDVEDPGTVENQDQEIDQWEQKLKFLIDKVTKKKPQEYEEKRE